MELEACHPSRVNWLLLFPRGVPHQSGLPLHPVPPEKTACILILSLYRPIFKVRSLFNGSFRW